jgi:hypothetical protein
MVNREQEDEECDRRRWRGRRKGRGHEKLKLVIPKKIGTGIKISFDSAQDDKEQRIKK